MFHKHRNYLRRLSSFAAQPSVDEHQDGGKVLIHPQTFETLSKAGSVNKDAYDTNEDVPLGHAIYVSPRSDGTSYVKMASLPQTDIEKRDSPDLAFDVTSELLPNLFKSLHHLFRGHKALDYSENPTMLGDTQHTNSLGQTTTNYIIPYIKKNRSNFTGNTTTTIKASGTYRTEEELKNGLHQLFSGLLLHSLRKLPDYIPIKDYLQENNLVKPREKHEHNIHINQDIKEPSEKHAYAESIVRQYSPILRDYIHQILNSKDEEVPSLPDFIKQSNHVSPELGGLLAEIISEDPHYGVYNQTISNIKEDNREQEEQEKASAEKQAKENKEYLDKKAQETLRKYRPSVRRRNS